VRASGILAALLALAGIACLAAAAAQGSLHVGLFLIAPFVYASGGWAFLGMMLLVAAAIAATLGGFSRVERASVAQGGLVLVGPIPIVWGSAGVRRWMLALGAAMLALWVLAAFALR